MTAAQLPYHDEPATLADEELARAIGAGSSSCFEELLCRYEGRLLQFLIRRAGNRHDAEDLLQETFARAYQRISDYDSQWKLSTWLFTIASRLACSHYRKRREPPVGEAGFVQADGPDPATIVAQREQRDNIWAVAAELLSTNQYTALWLRYSGAMSVKEIAHVMNKTATHVKVLLHRGRSGLLRRAEFVAAAGLDHGTEAAGKAYVHVAR